ncbi:MAG: hypothetical protein Q8K78_14005 [Planctomycetaceae bacterium]|nr:hypothetical protein [Planctomycetaceae bacterium]
MDDTGLEPPRFPSGNPASPAQGDAKSDASGAPSAIPAGVDDSDLARLLAVWSRLTPEDRAAIADHAETLAVGRPVTTTAEIRQGLIDRLFS